MKKLASLLVVLLLLVVSGCGKKNTIDDKVLVVGASTAPHAQIIEQCRSYIESKGYELEIIEYTDYVIPNLSLQDGSLDANFFQHLPYLEQFNEENNTDLASVLAVHFEPLGLYKGTGNDLANISDGSSIGIPNDVTNGARALQLLDKLGLIEVDLSKGLLATENDITSNPKGLVIVPLEAASIPAQLASLEYGVINGNYALSSGIDLTKLLATEDPTSLAATQYANVVAVKVGNEEKDVIKVLVEALKQQAIDTYIRDTYDGLVVSVLGTKSSPN